MKKTTKRIIDFYLGTIVGICLISMSEDLIYMVKGDAMFKNYRNLPVSYTWPFASIIFWGIVIYLYKSLKNEK